MDGTCLDMVSEEIHLMQPGGVKLPLSQIKWLGILISVGLNTDFA